MKYFTRELMQKSEKLEDTGPMHAIPWKECSSIKICTTNYFLLQN